MITTSNIIDFPSLSIGDAQVLTSDSQWILGFEVDLSMSIKKQVNAVTKSYFYGTTRRLSTSVKQFKRGLQTFLCNSIYTSCWMSNVFNFDFVLFVSFF